MRMFDFFALASILFLSEGVTRVFKISESVSSVICRPGELLHSAPRKIEIHFHKIRHKFKQGLGGINLFQYKETRILRLNETAISAPASV